jgi:biopolymer transport protein ExbD
VARFVPPAVEESISPNVVPLLDVMFLLMIFLMLGSDMSVRETADVQLATADAAKDAPLERVDRFVTLNVVPRAPDGWTYSLQGREFDGDALVERLTAVAGDAVEPASVADSGRPLSAVTLSIRCDRAAPYGLVQTAMAACATAGIHRLEVAAARPAED